MVPSETARDWTGLPATATHFGIAATEFSPEPPPPMHSRFSEARMKYRAFVVGADEFCDGVYVPFIDRRLADAGGPPKPNFFAAVRDTGLGSDTVMNAELVGRPARRLDT